MSLSDLLVNAPNNFDLFVNSINVASPVPSVQFDMTYLVQAATASIPQTLNTVPVVLQCKLMDLGGFKELFIPRWTLPSANQRQGILVASLVGTPLQGIGIGGNGTGFLIRAAGSYSECGYVIDSPNNILYVFNTQSSGGFVTGGNMDISGCVIPVRI